VAIQTCWIAFVFVVAAIIVSLPYLGRVQRPYMTGGSVRQTGNKGDERVYMPRTPLSGTSCRVRIRRRLSRVPLSSPRGFD
jgi:hypothetical protein